MYAVQPNAAGAFGAAGATAGALPTGENLQEAQVRYLTATAGSAPGDGISPNPWPNPGFPGGSGGSPGAGTGGGTSGGGFMGLVQNLINQLGAMINGMNGGGSGSGPAQQSVANATFTSTGDPHLSETGTINGANGTSSVDTHFDSMTGQTDLLSSHDFTGGYRLSTTVTSPNANGVTHNATASVTLNGSQDSVAMTKDGSFSITSGGTAMDLSKGESIGLSGGATVTENANGSLSINVQNANGGSIATTFTAEGGGVDVTAAVQNANVGGAIANYGSATAGNGTQPTPALG